MAEGSAAWVEIGARPRGGGRRWVLLGVALAGVAAALALGLRPSGLLPGPGGLALAGEFFRAALSPALTYEADFVPAGATPLVFKVLVATVTTVQFAAAAVGLSVVAGLGLGFLGSTAWWADDPAGGAGRWRRWFRRSLAPALYGVTRLVITGARSVHELIWAVIFLAAVGLTPLTAVIAIAIPYSGTLAKVFSEMVDEVPRDTALALKAAGGSPLQVYLLGLVPRALPDLITYIVYRFECGLRSSAVLGFFGVPTLGYYLKLAFDDTHYHEVWTYLYALVVLVVLFDQWSGLLRRRLTR